MVACLRAQIVTVIKHDLATSLVLEQLLDVAYHAVACYFHHTIRIVPAQSLRLSERHVGGLIAQERVVRRCHVGYYIRQNIAL
jgi:hypothetical protein